MYVFSKNNKTWTCPDSSIQELALIQADTQEDKKLIKDEKTAVEYMKYCGFDISHVEDPKPITEVPKVPNWYDRTHRDLYNKLFYQEVGRPLTEEENEFCKTMYHFEEYACGLDGDR